MTELLTTALLAGLLAAGCASGGAERLVAKPVTTQRPTTTTTERPTTTTTERAPIGPSSDRVIGAWGWWCAI